METESPVSNVGRVKFGWRLGTESETVGAVGAEATTVVATVISTVEATEVDDGVVGSSAIRVVVVNR